MVKIVTPCNKPWPSATESRTVIFGDTVGFSQHVFSSVGIEHWFTKPGVGSSSLSGRTTQLTTIADCCIINT